VSDFARSGYSVKSPDELSRPDVEGANGSAGSFRRKFLKGSSRDYNIFVDGRRRSHVVLSSGPVVRDALTKINCPAVAEALAGPARLGVKSEEASVLRCKEDALVELALLAYTGN
jgi:hypothetical protein